MLKSECHKMESFDKTDSTKNDVSENVTAYSTRTSSDVTPVYSTPEEIQNFNNWYYERANKLSTKPYLQNLSSTEFSSSNLGLYKSDNNKHCNSCSCSVTKTKANIDAKDNVAMKLNNVDGLYDT